MRIKEDKEKAKFADNNFWSLDTAYDLDDLMKEME